MRFAVPRVRYMLPPALIVTLVILLYKASVLHARSLAALTSTRWTLPQDVVRLFCHTDAGVHARVFPPRTVTRHNCFGDIRGNASRVVFHSNGIEAPRISALCLLNPYHGFHDCLWPLVHYWSTCATLPQMEKHYVIVNNAKLSRKRLQSWVVRAQLAFLRTAARSADIIDKSALAPGTAVCFATMVKFHKNAFWRPLRYKYQYIENVVENSTNAIISSHPELVKEESLMRFRSSVLTYFGLSSKLDTRHAPVLVYDRMDALRRQWLNAADFERQLRLVLPSNIPIQRISAIPRDFERQVRLYNKVAAVVAPHGANMVNTLFMKDGTVIVEIASRMCGPSRSPKNMTKPDEIDLDVAMNTTDPNTWTPWHTQYMPFVHIPAPCFISDSSTTGQFVTDNDGLVNLTLSMMIQAERFRVSPRDMVDFSPSTYKL